MKNRIKKVLIANRGEIAIRIHHSLKALDIATVGIYSEEDQDSYHVHVLDECFSLGAGTILETYLNIDKIISIAKKQKCDAIHPGYGFLSENYLFAKACESENLFFIGPSSKIIQIMGDKLLSKSIAKKLKIPVLESIEGNIEEIINKIYKKKIKFPLLIKASAGGGGKGMKILYNDQNLRENLESSAREAKNYFGDERIYLERYLDNPKHIEVQVIGDTFGNVFHLFERECSIQRRHQKIIEEAPSPSLTDNERIQLFDYAIRMAKEIGYYSLGTIEFLYDSNEFFFLEMNTRIQVEHATTESITGIDLVAEQIKILNNEKIDFRNVQRIGHSIEVRIYAEDPENNFSPSPGRILYYLEPKIPNIRIDSSVGKPTTLSSNFDPMISKVIAWGNTREEARKKLVYSLKNYVILGIQTNLNYLIDNLESEEFIKNQISTNFCNHFKPKINKENLDFLYLALEVYNRFKKSSPQDKDNKDDLFVWSQIGFWRNV
ncbi:MAG: acetyl/propionyl/methylcrotonyl-CoA carboxylase subunit alpha [Leptonema sp. (in: bacteria)]